MSLYTGDRERAGRLHDGARVFENIFDRGANFVGGNAHDFIHELLA